MVGSIWLEGIISQQSQANERAAMESATAIATEAVIAIRTVQSLGTSVHYLQYVHCMCMQRAENFVIALSYMYVCRG